MYPGLVNCTTIDYFTPWPDDALMAVAEKFMADVDLDIPMPGEMTAGTAAARDLPLCSIPFVFFRSALFPLWTLETIHACVRPFMHVARVHEPLRPRIVYKTTATT